MTPYEITATCIGAAAAALAIGPSLSSTAKDITVKLAAPWRGTGTHRAPSPAELARQNHELTTRLVAADSFFIRLIEDRDLVHAQAEEAARRAAEAEQVVACQQQEIERLTGQITALTAQAANQGAVSVPAGTRPIEQGDEPTTPIDVRPLRTALSVLPLKAAHNPAAS
ncbi:hypothetical protein [Streptomyces sp. C10-9-1]|uniref:hypothetical protein n=1 Tax=Streptomyces sp. C10-9-1 TaxID=1859285 RepID=UPI003F4A709D